LSRTSTILDIRSGQRDGDDLVALGVTRSTGFLMDLSFRLCQVPGMARGRPSESSTSSTEVFRWSQACVAARSFRPNLAASEENATSRRFLALVLLVPLTVRLWILATHSYIVWPDETFQYLEPAHRLAFGSGVLTWEFLDGVRSWFLPSIVAGVMWLVSLVDPDPAAYVLILRLLCVLASLSVPFVGFQLAARRCGSVLALFFGLLCALAYDTVYCSPVIMAEPMATDPALLAIWFGDSAGERRLARRNLLIAGLLFGLASSLRYQYAPVLGVVALLQHARSHRNLAIVAAGSIPVVVSLLGGLDALTWGAPVSRATGTEDWYYTVPIYFETWDDAQKIEHTAFRLRLEGMLGGRPVIQYPGPALAVNTGRFNVIVGKPSDALPDFSERACYGQGSADDPVYCVFTRPGGCE
jgi:hypothetical protein